MIPIYRLSEGKENLIMNEEAFKYSKEILSANGIVLIFIEGVCVHKHELQPFKKGAARIAKESKMLTDLKVMPLGIAYNSFERVGKAVNIIIGEPIPVNNLLPFEEEAKNLLHFNERIFEEIARRIAIPENNSESNKIKKHFFFLPGIVGFLLHLPLYSLLRNAVRNKTRGTVFFDSVLFGALLLLYPLYLLTVVGLLLVINAPLFFIFFILLIHPLTARCAVSWRAEIPPYS